MNATKTTSSGTMVPIPGGEATLGLSSEAAETLAQRFRPPGSNGISAMPSSAFFAETPAHRLLVAPFKLQKTEVTNAEFKEFVDAGGYAREQWWADLVDMKAPNCHGVGLERAQAFVDASGRPGPAGWRGGTFPAGKERHAVEGVSWFEAAAFARWRGLRLPGEAEWEVAARGKDGRVFPWGDDEKVAAKIAGQAAAVAAGTVAEDRSPFGIMDMAGGVAEWVADVWWPYEGSPVWRPAKADENVGVVRGGAAGSPAAGQRTTCRRPLDRFARQPGVGFRCAGD